MEYALYLLVSFGILMFYIFFYIHQKKPVPQKRKIIIKVKRKIWRILLFPVSKTTMRITEFIFYIWIHVFNIGYLLYIIIGKGSFRFLLTINLISILFAVVLLVSELEIEKALYC